MQRLQQLAIALVLLGILVFGAVAPQPAKAQDDTSEFPHTVQTGETLYSIARRYNVTVLAISNRNNITNPNLIFSGQILNIPGLLPTGPSPNTEPQTTEEPGEDVTDTPSPAPPVETVTSTPTPPPPANERRHVVAQGENLFRIALQYGTTVQAIVQLNGLANPNVIYVGQELRIPPAGQPGETPPPVTTVAPVTTAEPDATEEPVATEEEAIEATLETETPEPQNEARTVEFDYGVEVFLQGQELEPIIAHVSDLGVNWVKQEVSWALIEPIEGTFEFAELDAIVDELDSAGVNILLTVTTAPTWARTSSQETGPPDDYQKLANFVGTLAQRYNGRVDAYEIWSEPNLRQKWNGRPISGSEYVNMLRPAFGAIKTADSSAVVVTAGLAPTGTNDGVNAVDDRVYLRQMYAAGVADVSDAIGAHPFGWANPPNARCCQNTPDIFAWDDHPSFFFLETLEDYRAIMMENGDSGTVLWVTAFGWGSSEGYVAEGGLPIDIDDNIAFVDEVSLDEQSAYTRDAFRIADDLTYVGPMFYRNLNVLENCRTVSLQTLECFSGMLDPFGNPRPPLFSTVRDLATSASESE
jgi:LysM repeat protein